MYPTKKKHIQLVLPFFGGISNFSAISFLQFCSPIIHQFIPENSFDLLHIGVSNQSGNKGGVKIECHNCFNIHRRRIRQNKKHTQ